jgi:hypothetical protein
MMECVTNNGVGAAWLTRRAEMSNQEIARQFAKARKEKRSLYHADNSSIDVFALWFGSLT